MVKYRTKAGFVSSNLTDIFGLVNVLILIDIENSLLTSRGQVNGTNSEIQ